MSTCRDSSGAAVAAFVVLDALNVGLSLYQYFSDDESSKTAKGVAAGLFLLNTASTLMHHVGIYTSSNVENRSIDNVEAGVLLFDSSRIFSTAAGVTFFALKDMAKAKTLGLVNAGVGVLTAVGSIYKTLSFEAEAKADYRFDALEKGYRNLP